jgi:histone arginine demethylase JMJD6
MKIDAVARRSASAGFDDIFDNFFRTSTPVVLEGAACEWPARAKWTPEFFCSRYGAVEVEFTRFPTDDRVVARVSDYFALPDAEKSRWYLSDWDFRKRNPELLEDIVVPELFDLDWIDDLPAAERPDLCWIYIGHAGTRGPIHLDNYGTSAWLAVLQGVKRVRFAVPREGRSRELATLDAFDDGCIQAVAEELSEARLSDGDVLFVPAGRWHAAMNDTYCLSVTANFVDGANFCLHRRFATRRWYGKRMLVNAIERLKDLPEGPERSRLSRHLSLALNRYVEALEEEREHAEALMTSLREAAPGTNASGNCGPH